LDLKKFESKLNTKILGKAPGWKNEIWDSIESTNDRALELTKLGAPEGVIVIAHNQTKGRGRLGRSWLSVMNAGVYMSIITTPKLPLSTIPVITIAMGVASALAIRKISNVQVNLKWINDLVHKDKKIGGILAEMSNTSVIVGIGINLRINNECIPSDLVHKLDSLENIASESIDDNALAAEIVNCFEETYFDLLAAKHNKIIDTWRQLSSTLGRSIKTIVGSTTIEGKAIDINEDGTLIVEDINGKQHLLHSGEVSIRAADGNYV
jgi:BirA family biotin operon repressor/biotin-[acetyl-CoA-carboxylase] ligase